MEMDKIIGITLNEWLKKPRGKKSLTDVPRCQKKITK
jgi:hypothetical protein